MTDYLGTFGYRLSLGIGIVFLGALLIGPGPPLEEICILTAGAWLTANALIRPD